MKHVFYSESTVKTMSINELKVQILESVGGLDQTQSKKVLDYIRRVVRSRRDHEDYHNFKRRAMEEIQVAIDNNGDPQPA
ncbi:MAG: hypothetical protein E2O88_06920 [Bacteroidetes bacterium]|nr:MAG: hypothetical protein E2O88_06920 [Bacteroidota bacterium]